jgi:hypothetical protein
VLDVHPPHEPVHGWRDFVVHLFTITIGLLIALSLEGIVEWQHHRHLVHDAEINMHEEIRQNASDMQDRLTTLHKEQTELTHDIDLLKQIAATHTMPKGQSMEVSFAIRDFDDVSWKTAQATGALSYMPYDRAKEYSDIYSQQVNLSDEERTAARDTAVAASSFIRFGDNDKDPVPPTDQINLIIDRVAILIGQTRVVESYMKGLAGNYDNFLKAHPGTE